MRTTFVTNHLGHNASLFWEVNVVAAAFFTVVLNAGIYAAASLLMEKVFLKRMRCCFVSIK